MLFTVVYGSRIVWVGVLFHDPWLHCQRKMESGVSYGRGAGRGAVGGT